MPYTLMTAAQAAGVNRSTVLRSIKAGRISATKDELTGAWLIEPSELHRVYPPVALHEAAPVAVPDAPAELRADVLVAELRDMIARMERTHERALGDLQRDRDEWREISKRLVIGAPVAPQRLTWWRWLRSTG
jgi:hypothetical protein